MNKHKLDQMGQSHDKLTDGPSHSCDDACPQAKEEADQLKFGLSINCQEFPGRDDKDHHDQCAGDLLNAKNIRRCYHKYRCRRLDHGVKREGYSHEGKVAKSDITTGN